MTKNVEDSREKHVVREHKVRTEKIVRIFTVRTKPSRAKVAAFV